MDQVTNSATLHNLHPNTKYRLKMFAESEAGRSSASNALKVNMTKCIIGTNNRIMSGLQIREEFPTVKLMRL